MDYELLARFCSLKEDDEILVLAFSAEELGAGEYAMLQHPLRPDEQDSRLFQDGLYIERNDQMNGCYLGVESIKRTNDRIEIQLTEKGKQCLKVQRIFITPVPWSPTISNGLARLADLSSGEYEVHP